MKVVEEKNIYGKTLLIEIISCSLHMTTDPDKMMNFNLKLFI